MVEATKVRDEARSWLARALDVPSAFPWQLDLLDQMLAGDLPSAVDIPTGMGKTAVIAVWLVAQAAAAHVARRLVYVVDRRAVVDQATAVAESLRDFVERDAALKTALGLERHRSLAISTLRGQFLDNREWLSDPSAPAIVVGTVDMVGSRLLFEGYGVSRRMRPYHAGLLGADSLVILDEAHLVSPFEHLLRSIEQAADNGLGARNTALDITVPRLRLLPLSATGRSMPATGRSMADPITLTSADRADCEVKRRLTATKDLVMRPGVAPKELPERLAEEAWALIAKGTKPIRCILFCNRRSDAQAVRDQLTKRVGQVTSSPAEIELFVGGRRVWERAEAADWLRTHGFLAGSDRVVEKSAFVIATSAGEVGVDLDADHMVSDLVPWERMVQRLGRVNRRGRGAAEVVVVPTTEEDDVIAYRLAAVSELLKELPRTERGGFDASPGALDELKRRSTSDGRLCDLIARGSTPEPLYPPLTRPVLEAWSMTSLEDHTGRPHVERWLRGWIPDDELQTTVVWRELLPVTRDGGLLSRIDLDAYLEAAEPRLAEQLETETWRVAAWLFHRVRALKSKSDTAAVQSAPPLVESEVAVAVDVASTPGLGTQNQSMRGDQVVGVVLPRSKDPWPITLRDLSNKDKRDEIERRLAGGTVLVDVRLGGLAGGLLDGDSEQASDVTTLRRPTGEPALPIQVRRTRDLRETEVMDKQWRQEARIAIDHSGEDDEIEWLVIESLVTEPAESEEGRAIAPRRAQKLDVHEEWTERAARQLAQRLALPPRYTDMLALAARLHDEGKRAPRWQRAFRADSDGVYAKTTSRPNIHLLAGYRHELGSLPRAERDGRVQSLDDDLRDLCLHLIAAHHGYARPLLRTDGAEEPPSRLEARARDIALRFTRLEKRWGPWGLAWWEALLRAADQQASRENDEAGIDG